MPLLSLSILVLRALNSDALLGLPVDQSDIGNGVPCLLFALLLCDFFAVSRYFGIDSADCEFIFLGNIIPLRQCHGYVRNFSSLYRARPMDVYWSLVQYAGELFFARRNYTTNNQGNTSAILVISSRRVLDRAISVLKAFGQK